MKIQGAKKKSGIKRRIISLGTKIQILDKFNTGEGPTAIARYFGVHEATVRAIKKNEAKIRASVQAGSESLSLNRTCVRTMEVMENALIVWIRDNMERNIHMDSESIRNEAMRIFDSIKDVQSPSKNTFNKFTANEEWYEKFIKKISFII